METKKSILEIIVMPLVLVFVGSLGTFLITNQQIQSSKLQTQAQTESTEKMTKSDQQIKIIEIFSEKITSKDIREREIAVRILGALDPDLAQKLMSAVAESSNNDPVIKNIAIELKNNFIKSTSYVVAGSFDDPDKAANYAKILINKGLPYSVKVYKNEKGVYAVCLGNELNFTEATKLSDLIKKKGLVKEVYVKTSKFWTEIDY